MNPAVFREYDIRGVADRDLDDSFVRALGRSLGTLYARRGKRRIAIGRDCRVSSPRIHEELRAGLVEAGLSLVDVGVVPTPLLYFAVHHFDLDGGVQITGSHNPPEDNGVKMMLGKGSLYGDDIRVLRAMVADGDFEPKVGGSIVERDPTPAYVGFVRGNVRLARRDLRFAVDAGNGAGGPLAIAAMRALGLAPIPLLCEMDGRFPVHHPDPTEPHNLELLVETVRSRGLDFGIAFDGDADRIGVVDARGEVLWGDKLLVVLARDLLLRHPGAAVLGEVKCSQTLYDDIAARGGRPILWKTGHSLIKTKMREERALLAGEMSGHVFFADRFFGFDDAIYTAVRLIEILAREQRPLHEYIDDLPTTFITPELRAPCSDETKFAVVQKVLDHYRATHRVVDVDGARILFDRGWGLVRASNTQAVLVMRFEADTPERRDELRAEVEALVARLAS